MKTKSVCLIQAVPVFADPNEFASAIFRFDSRVEELIEDFVSFVRRETNRIASDFQKGAKLPGKWRVRGSVR